MYYDKKVESNNKIITLRICDTAGQERFQTITSSYYRKSDAIIFTYDITNTISFQKIDFWMSQAKNNIDLKNFPKILVGNKSDLNDKREVSYDEARVFAESRNMKFYETSAKLNSNVKELFDTIMNEILIQEELNKEQNDPNYINKFIVIDKNTKQKIEKSKCC